MNPLFSTRPQHIVLLGGKCGKTTLLNRVLDKTPYTDDYCPTLQFNRPKSHKKQLIKRYGYEAIQKNCSIQDINHLTDKNVDDLDLLIEQQYKEVKERKKANKLQTGTVKEIEKLNISEENNSNMIDNSQNDELDEISLDLYQNSTALLYDTGSNEQYNTVTFNNAQPTGLNLNLPLDKTLFALCVDLSNSYPQQEDDRNQIDENLKWLDKIPKDRSVSIILVGTRADLIPEEERETKLKNIADSLKRQVGPQLAFKKMLCTSAKETLGIEAFKEAIFENQVFFYRKQLEILTLVKKKYSLEKFNILLKEFIDLEKELKLKNYDAIEFTERMALFQKNCLTQLKTLPWRLKNLFKAFSVGLCTTIIVFTVFSAFALLFGFISSPAAILTGLFAASSLEIIPLAVSALWGAAVGTRYYQKMGFFNEIKTFCDGLEIDKNAPTSRFIN